MQTKKLAIFDLDNTLTDTFALWRHVTEVALELLSVQFDLDNATILQAYKSSPSQYRFADFEKIVDWLDHNHHLPTALDGHDQYRKNATKAYICDRMRKARAEMSCFYTDAAEALDDLKAAGTDTVIYTDAEAAPTIKRLWLMARNSGGDPLTTLKKFSHVYCRPSFECDSTVLRDIDPEFILEMKRRMTLWSDGVCKPAPDHTQVILNDFGVTAKEAVMIGDSDRDGGSAVPLGVDFAWFRRGAVCTPEAARTVESICSPGWNYGEDYIRSRFNASSAPTVIIDDLRNLKTLFAFGPGNGFRSSDAPTGVHRIQPHFLIRKNYPGIGPHTHL